MTQFLIPLCYLTLYIVWGSTYFFIKVAVETLPPITLLGLRFTIGGALLLGLAALTDRIRTRPTWRQLGASALLGALLLLGGNGLITVAEKKVDSYALVNPLIATMLGLLVGNESAVPLLGIGLPLVLLGTTLMLYGEAALARFKRRRSEAASLSGPG